MKKRAYIALTVGMLALAGLMLVTTVVPRAYVQALSFDELQGYGVDTIAGYSTLLTSSKTYPNREVVFHVGKPEGGVVTVSATTDQSGIAKVDLYDYHTRRAGTYSVGAALKGSLPISRTSFTVYPDEVSEEKSTLGVQKNVARADGNDQVYVTVTLHDQYGNPFQGHSVSLISSRAHDNVAAASGSSTTDSNGNVHFVVSSGESGVSVLSAVDSTSGGVLASRAQVAFLKADAYMDDVGGSLTSFIPIAAAQDAGPLHHFEIGDLPETIQPNQNVTFRVTAQDQNDLTVENYTGVVHFSADGDNGSNVELPEDYTFKAEDLGTHQFSLGLKFTTAGTYKIVATDINNTAIKGEKTVTAGSGGTQQQQGGAKPVITSPQSGTSSQNVQTITGSAPAGMNIKIFDNDQEIGAVQADSSGSFSYQTTPLSDGDHEVYVVTLDSSNTVQGTSDTIMLTIDTTAPTVDEIQITPTTGIMPGQVLSIKVLSEENLSEAAMIFNSEIFELTPSLDQPGAYVASLTAPATAGEYTIDVVLVDELGNESTSASVATVAVSADGGSVATQEETQQETQETQTQETQVSDNLPPSQVFGVIAYGSDKRVTLIWEAATDEGAVDHYKVYYGLDPANLDQQADTFDAATTWYIPDLENGKEYFFAISAVDDLDTESLTMSELVSGIPFTLEVQTQLPERPTAPLASGGDDALLHGAAIEGRVPPEMSKQGPEALWLLVGTGGVSAFVRRLRRRR
ncbi:MAG TPA: Ig-like domain-containing protein [Candidatus Gracilibacteria bacterium]|nr:Ig-like domain-containing protein [Candidatus Gracilibacteria bacterium]